MSEELLSNEAGRKIFDPTRIRTIALPILNHMHYSLGYQTLVFTILHYPLGYRTLVSPLLRSESKRSLKNEERKREKVT